MIGPFIRPYLVFLGLIIPHDITVGWTSRAGSHSSGSSTYGNDLLDRQSGSSSIGRDGHTMGHRVKHIDSTATVQTSAGATDREGGSDSGGGGSSSGGGGGSGMYGGGKSAATATAAAAAAAAQSGKSNGSAAAKESGKMRTLVSAEEKQLVRGLAQDINVFFTQVH